MREKVQRDEVETAFGWERDKKVNRKEGRDTKWDFGERMWSWTIEREDNQW